MVIESYQTFLFPLCCYVAPCYKLNSTLIKTLDNERSV
nr:MAG TPA: hypothetical protein [Caudoviricetes sp.]